MRKEEKAYSFNVKWTEGSEVGVKKHSHGKKACIFGEVNLVRMVNRGVCHPSPISVTWKREASDFQFGIL